MSSVRRSRRGQKHGPGDRVEVVRDEGVAIGRLVRLVEQDSDGDAPSVPRWIVSFEGETAEQEVTEKNLGRIVESSETEDASTAAPPPPKGRNNKAKKGQSPPRSSKTIIKGQQGGEKDGRPSTRAALKVTDKALLKGIKVKKKTAPKNIGAHRPPGENESVVKVKMLTGTLYLYRGLNPRAEFIRTV